MRKNIIDILTNEKVDIAREYNRLLRLYHDINHPFGQIPEKASEKFILFSPSFKKRAISLSDFEETFDLNFYERNDVSIDYLLLFCEFTSNICNQLKRLEPPGGFYEIMTRKYETQLKECLDVLGFEQCVCGELIICVEKNAYATAVAEITASDLSYRVLEYNHFLIKGDIETKLSILKLMADDIEPDRKKLNGINSTLSNHLFEMLNRFVRHNNSDNEFISSLSDEELESWYDDIYQMWLLAKLELDHLERKQRVADVLTKIR